MRLEHDDWTTWWAIVPPTIPAAIQGREHPLPTTRQKATRVSFWELLPSTTNTSAFEAVERCGQYYSRELFDRDLPFVVRRDAGRADLTPWLWTVPDRTGGYKILGACGVRREERISVHPFMVLEWVWIHPYGRHRGLWTEAYKILLARYERLALDAVTTALRLFLHGKPYHELSTMAGKVVRLYSQEPWCPTHGPMIEPLRGVWRCGVKQDDGTVCPAQYPAPVQAPRPR